MGARRISGVIALTAALVALAPASASAETSYYLGPAPTKANEDEGFYYLLIRDGVVRRSFFIFDARCKGQFGGPPTEGGLIGEFPRAKVRRDGSFSVLRHRRGGLVQFAGRVEAGSGIDARYRGRSAKGLDDFGEPSRRCDTGTVDIHLDEVDRDAWREFTGLGPGSEDYVCLTVITSPSCMT